MGFLNLIRIANQKNIRLDDIPFIQDKIHGRIAGEAWIFWIGAESEVKITRNHLMANQGRRRHGVRNAVDQLPALVFRKRFQILIRR